MITNNMRLEALDRLLEAVSAATEAARDLGISYPELTALEQIGVEAEEVILPADKCLATIQFTFDVDYVESVAVEQAMTPQEALMDLALDEFTDAYRTALVACVELTWSNQ